MGNEIVKTENQIDVWAKPDKIRQLFAPTLTNDEFMFFIGLGKSMKANPFKREIWAIKYDSKKPASVFLGRDFYRKAAQSQPDYKVHRSFAIYENDVFKVTNGIPVHEFTLKNRGKLIGAYADLWKKNIDMPFVVYVDLTEYDKKFSNWKTMPSTMITKVAEAQVLRMAYQEIFAGTYSEDEQWKQESELSNAFKQEPPTLKKETEKEPTVINAEVIEPEIVEPENKKSEEKKEKSNGNLFEEKKVKKDYKKLIQDWLYCEFSNENERTDKLKEITSFGEYKGQPDIEKLKPRQLEVTWHKIENEMNKK